MGFPGGSVVENLPAKCRRHRFDPTSIETTKLEMKEETIGEGGKTNEGKQISEKGNEKIYIKFF